MKDAVDTPAYPGDDASALDRLELAHAYHRAALALFAAPRKSAEDQAPARLCALHAIELYVAAFLSYQGTSAVQIRARNHNVYDATMCAKLELKPKAAQHLEAIGDRREYLMARYDARGTGDQSQINRLKARLIELTEKVRKHIADDIAKSGP